MAKVAVDHEYLSDVWNRINSVISEQGTNKAEIAEKCGFNRKTLYSYRNLTLTYFARLCEELNISADFFLFGLDKKKERTNKAMYQPDKCYEDMPETKKIIKEVEKARKMLECNGNVISINNWCGIIAQKELMTLADNFCLLHRKDVQKIIENCKSYDEGHNAIMRVYNEVYLQ